MAVDKDPDKFQFTGPLQFFELELPEIGVDYKDVVRKLGELGYKVTGSAFGILILWVLKLLKSVKK
jgi:hypothetical protein